jgi:cyclophilin family peptidyl-prolyl cis-trans isomerase/HEAT repeat protein
MKNIFAVLIIAALAAVLFAGEKKELTFEEKLVRIAELEAARTANAELFGYLKSGMPDPGYELSYRASRALGRIGDGAAAPYIAERLFFLSSCHAILIDGMRENLFAAGQLWDACPDNAVARYLQFGKPNGFAVAALAIEALGKAGPSGVRRIPEILALIADPDEKVRGEIPLALMRLQIRLVELKDNSTVVMDSVPKILPLASDNSAEVRWRTAYALQYLPRPEAKAALIALLKDSDERARMFAATALGKHPGDDALAALLDAMNDPSWLVQVNAIASLEKYPMEKSVERMMAALKDKNFHVRERAVRALGMLKAESAKDAVAKLLVDDCPAVRGKAAIALAKMLGARAFPLITPLLADNSPYAMAALADACAEIGGDEAVKMLRRLWDASKDVRAQSAVLGALLEMGDKSDEGCKIVKLAIRVPQFMTRCFAIEILSKSNADWAYASIKSLYPEIAKERGPSDSLRYMIVQCVKERTDKAMAASAKEDLAFLETATKDPCFEVRSRAAEAIQIATGKVIPAAPDSDPPQTLAPGKDFSLKPGKNPRIAIETTRGKMVVELFAADAPHHVARTLELAKKKFYDGLFWHRVENNFVIQGGCPWGIGCGDGGFRLPLEINMRKFERGTVGMARSAERDSGSCQLFICHSPQPKLDGKYTVYGQVVEGLEVIDLVQQGDAIVSVKILD